MDTSHKQSDRYSIPVPAPLKKSSTNAVPLAVVPSDEPARSDSALSSSASHTINNYYDEEDTSPTQGRSRSSTMSLFSSKPTPPNLGPSINSSAGAQFDANSIKTDKPLAKTPSAKSPGASKLGSFFGWGGQTSPASSHTTFSEDRDQEGKDYSQLGSPMRSGLEHKRTTPGVIDVATANYGEQSYFDDPYPPTPTTPSDIGEMEEELREISQELATSIRREMELEDLVERLQMDLETPRTTNQRTSDYFSDSGYSGSNSTLSKFGGDLEARADEVDKSLRKAEREKAQVRLDCQEKVEEERSKRKGLEKQIRQLEEKASQVDLLSMNSLDASGRLKDLEATCENLRRHLAEEKQLKENFEDLLGALKSDLEASHSENDNLKDEVMPQLRARVEGLEAQAVKQEKLAYEMQQEMQALKEENDELVRDKSAESHDNGQQQEILAELEKDLYEVEGERNYLRDEVVPTLQKRVDGLEVEIVGHKESAQQTQLQVQLLRNENSSLSSARVAQTDMQRHMDSIGEDGFDASFMPSGLKRSSSVTRSIHSGTPMRSRPQSMTFNKGVVVESRDMLAERVKDVEAQRDALHRALKSLLERQEYQNRENEKKLKQLEMERDRALKIRDANGRAGYDREVSNLRAEINTLRVRADEAILQKWQCEKGLGGLKMDLDRAQQEIESLKTLLEDGRSAASRDINDSNRISYHSGNLEHAYRELQKSYENSLERIRALESQIPKDEETERALKQLERSLSDAIDERDFARQEAESYRNSMESLYSNEKKSLDNEIQLADELRATAERVEQLASQVRSQLASNAALRTRLAETIERGDSEQKMNADRIMHMQSKLRSLEEALMAAQHKSEDSVARHEEEIAHLKDARSSQLVRIKEKLQSPRMFSPKSQSTPLFSGIRSPRVDFTSSGKAQSVEEQTQMKALKRRVEDLERALEEADGEMEEVVGRMNVAQIEVMELQNEREESVRLTKKLQQQIEQERMRTFEEKFKSLSS